MLYGQTRGENLQQAECTRLLVFQGHSQAAFLFIDLDREEELEPFSARLRAKHCHVQVKLSPYSSVFNADIQCVHQTAAGELCVQAT